MILLSQPNWPKIIKHKSYSVQLQTVTEILCEYFSIGNTGFDEDRGDNTFDFAGEGTFSTTNIEASNSFDFPSSTSQDINLQDYLKDNGENPPVKRFFFGGNREGSPCVTPTGKSTMNSRTSYYEVKNIILYLN